MGGSRLDTLELLYKVLRDRGILRQDGERLAYKLDVPAEYICEVKNVEKATELLSDLLTGKLSLDQIQRKPVRKESSSPYKARVIEDHIKENYAEHEYLIRILIEKLKQTRATKRITDNKMIEILTSLIPYPQWKVLQGIQVYLVGRYWTEKKDERYLRGIIRGQTKQWALVSKESIKHDLMVEYGYEERWDDERVRYMMRSIGPKIEENWNSYVESLK